MIKKNFLYFIQLFLSVGWELFVLFGIRLPAFCFNSVPTPICETKMARHRWIRQGNEMMTATDRYSTVKCLYFEYLISIISRFYSMLDIHRFFLLKVAALLETPNEADLCIQQPEESAANASADSDTAAKIEGKQPKEPPFQVILPLISQDSFLHYVFVKGETQTFNRC